ncbi:Mur ligase domain-containing protein [Thermaerobacter composti]|uniref:Mur ligase domain-containing protein n=1 Tax=Thermaerobacter composti TaxID=554949 RepID=A0ABZ0QMR8_9FIRM|nr:Mur ligase domain-containing protein [Thermaerobacter composti]WPD18696.1 Mur ligase domain-containing protein [Thermaerobacter composti]
MGSMALDLGQLLDGLTFVASGDPLPARVAEIRSHSARVEPGDLFVAVPGRRHDGAAFAGEALRRGARVVVAEQAPALPLPPGVTWLRVPSARRALSRLAANRYGHPSRRLVVVGVTGTTGKTTTTLLLHHLLTAAGIATGVMGSLVVDTGRRRRPGHLTTPAPSTSTAISGRWWTTAAGRRSWRCRPRAPIRDGSTTWPSTSGW